LAEKLGGGLPSDLEWNEKFSNVIINDFSGKVGWTRSAQNGWVIHPADAYDNIARSVLPVTGWTPNPQPPQQPRGGVKVDHWTGTWRVGSVQIGKGLSLKDVTWQAYQDHGNHE
jgi:hypothetical protein